MGRLHHAAGHWHFREPRGHLEQTARLRTYLYVAQLSLTVLALPLHGKAQLWVEPEVADLAVRVGRLVLYGAAAVDGFVPHFVAGATLVTFRLLPIAASILHVAGAEESGGITHALALSLRGHFHVHVLLRHQYSGSLGCEVYDDCPGAALQRVL